LHKHLLRKKKLSQLHQLLQQVLQHLLRKKKLSQQLSLLTKRLSLSKASLLRSKPVRIIVLELEDHDLEVELEDYAHRGYARPRVQDDDQNDPDYLPEHIRWKLFLARQAALLKYREARA
jgi:hypothetical protein